MRIFDISLTALMTIAGISAEAVLTIVEDQPI